MPLIERFWQECPPIIIGVNFELGAVNETQLILVLMAIDPCRLQLLSAAPCITEFSEDANAWRQGIGLFFVRPLLNVEGVILAIVKVDLSNVSCDFS